MSKHSIHFIEDTPILEELKIANILHSESGIYKDPENFGSKDELQYHRNSSLHGQVPRPISNHKKSKDVKAANSFPCPEPTDILPCVCSMTGINHPSLDCSAIESGEQLAGVFTKDFPFKQFYEFSINNNGNINYLSDIFNGVTFIYIRLYNMPNLGEITNYAFLDSKNTLEFLYIDRTAVNGNTIQFNEYPNLKSCTFAGSNIDFSPAIASASITTFGFYNNHLTDIYAGRSSDIFRKN